MVSFSCETCNDVLTKKKLDNHRNQCRAASFSCLDCMQQFRGTDYRAHTSCVTEAQKYHGSTYRAEGERKTRSKSGKHGPRDSMIPKKAYVEDAPDHEANGDASGDALPRAPSPPPAAGVNVFDFLVDETPNGSSAVLAPAESMKMVKDAPAVFEAGRHLAEMSTANASRETFGESRYGETGFHYGEGPVPTINANEHLYQTPAPHRERHRERERERDQRDPDRDRDREHERRRRRDEDGRREHKKDNKRKRVHIEDLDLTSARPRQLERDEVMTDAPPELHTGLTGGLTRLLSRPSEYPPSPDYSGGDGNQPSPNSPLKRSKHSLGEKGLSAITALVSTRKTSSNSEETARPRKHRRKHRHRHAEAERPSQKLKAIEYRPETEAEANPAQNQLVVYRTRAELFMSFVKGPDSSKGCSLNKALKRYHRERSDIGLGLGKGEEEKELWKTLRLRRNDRGEVVIFF